VSFLDDDSYPLPGSIPRALTYLGRHSKTAALVARVILPDGTFEAPALPAVTLGGASILRTAALKQVGGFAPEFFRQAEEYDMSFRLWQAGYRIERFEDVVFGHDKVAAGRTPALTHRMDLRNNLILVERYLPRQLRRQYRRDFVRRYGLLGIHAGHRDAINSALHEARVWARREASVGRKTVGEPVIEQMLDLRRQATTVGQWARLHSLRRVALADFSKNIYATYDACRQSGLEVSCVIDNQPAFAKSRYRGLPILTANEAKQGAPLDGIVLTTINPAHIERRMQELQAQFDVPILRLWHPRLLQDPAHEPVAGPAPRKEVA
jgi:hypothetical protein